MRDLDVDLADALHVLGPEQGVELGDEAHTMRRERGSQRTRGNAVIAERSIDVGRPPTEVYEFLVDQDNWAALDPATLDVTPRGEVHEGMTGTVTRRVGGRRVKNGFLITALVPDSLVSMRITGPGYALTETTTLEAASEGTRVSIVDVLEPTSLGGRVFVAVSGPFIRRDLKARSERLRSLLGDAAGT